MSAAVRAGFKRTDVGVIPEDWKLSLLDAVANIIDPQPDHRTPPEIAGGHPYIGISDFKDEYSVDWDASRKIISSALDKQEASFQIRPGDIVFGKIGTIGRPKFLPVVPFRYALSANILLIQPNIEPYFVMAWLRSSEARKSVDRELHSTSQAAFGIHKMRGLLIPQPPAAEQRAIAAALSDMDALLAKLDALVAKKRDLKVAAMQQLLTGQTRLPGFSGKWVVKRLGDVAELLKGSGLSKGVYHVSGVRKCILYGELFTTYGQVIVDVVGRTDSPDGRPSQAGDVLIPGSTTTDGIDLATASALLEDGIALGGDINIIRCKSKQDFNAQFLANYLTNVKKLAIAERAQGTTIVHLYGRDLADLSVDCPALAEQTDIATVLSDMDAELAALEARRDKTRALKQGMMQELLTGRIRLT